MTECVCLLCLDSNQSCLKALTSERRGGLLHLVGLLCSCPCNISPLPLCVCVSLWGDRAVGSVGSDQVLVVVVPASLRSWTVLAVLCVLAVSSCPAPFLFWGGVLGQVYHCTSCWGHSGGSSSSGDSCHAHRSATSRFTCEASAAVSWWMTICFRNACRGKAHLKPAAAKCVEQKHTQTARLSSADLHILTTGYSGVLLRSRSLSFSLSSLMGCQEPSVKYSISSISSLVSFNISESSLKYKLLVRASSVWFHYTI